MVSQEELNSIRQKVFDSVYEILENSSTQFKVKAAADTITDYVLHNVPKSTDADRYTWYYTVLGMAVNIARGWKQNCLADLKNPDDTQSSIQDYLMKTYGANFTDYP